MNSARRTIALCVVSLLSIAMVWIVQRYVVKDVERPDATQMRHASETAGTWFDIVLRTKDSLHLVPGEYRNKGYRGLLGDESSSFTTTLGSLDAKETTLNPDFAALVVRILNDEGFDSTKRIGVTLSGSFATLGIATLAALKSMGIKPVLLSSLGASSFGANQPNATWLDYERWLCNEGELTVSSVLVTYGGEGDSGGGIQPEGLVELDAAAQRAGKRVFVPRDLQEAISVRVKILSEEHVDLLINLGGNQAILGGCIHGSTHPNGFHRSLKLCADADRGVIAEMNSRGIPILQFLNIRDLAAQYSLPLGLSLEQSEKGVFQIRTVDRWPVAGMLALITGAVVLVGKRSWSKRKNSIDAGRGNSSSS